MKLMIFLLSILLGFSSLAEEILRRRGKFTYPKSEVELLTHQINKNIKIEEETNNALSEVKFEMINGNLGRAKLLLRQYGFKEKKASLVRDRYLAIIYFIEGDFERSLSVINNRELDFKKYFSTICSLKTLNEIILHKIEAASKTWSACYKDTMNDSPTENLWPNVIMALKTNQNDVKEDFIKNSKNVENQPKEFIRLYLKTLLYIGEQRIIMDNLKNFPSEVYEDSELRELIGFLYYKENKFVEAYKLINDLETPNAENIKGNFYLGQKKYDLAYGQFKLALLKKNNSENALDRLLPLSWLLSQWGDGINYIEAIPYKNELKYYKLKVLKASFLAMKGDYQEAQVLLDEIIKGSTLGKTKEVSDLSLYIATELKNSDNALISADNSCKNYSPLACWYLYQLTVWENFPETLTREDVLFQKDEEKLEAFLKPKDETFKEEKFINQRDIEELDQELIRLGGV